MRKLNLPGPILAALIGFPAFAQIPDNIEKKNPADYIHVSTAQEANDLRATLIQRIFNRATIDTTQLPVLAQRNVVVPGYVRAANLRNVSRWSVTMQYGWTSLFTLFAPVTTRPGGSAGMIYHAGHDQACTNEQYFIKQFVAAGYVVACLDMPLTGANAGNKIVAHERGDLLIREHEEMEQLRTATFNPLSLFVTPVSIVVNHFVSQGVNEIAMAGLSGGGWTTDLAAALDKRIDISFSVAGSMPFYARAWAKPAGQSIGDYEQWLPGLQDIVDYFDLYMLAGQNARHHNIYIVDDDCCFGGHAADHWKSFLSERMADIGGQYSIFYDTTTDDHMVSTWTTGQILARVSAQF
jgi:hypothetical protein